MTRTRFVLAAAALFVAIPCVSRVPALAASVDPGAYGQQYDRDAPPREFNEIQRRGFRDGMEGARKDYGNGRRPNVNNREEYRNDGNLPRDIPPRMWGAYREGFRRGYQQAAQRLWGGMAPAPAPPPEQQWEWGMRGLGDAAARQGYRDGVQEARNDYRFQRRADPDDGPRYRNPPVAPEMIPTYRAGFMRGYTVAMSQLSGDPNWQMSGDPSEWAPPDGYSDMQRRGFRDGIEGARRDWGNHRMADPNNRDEYRRPPVPPQFWREYRRGFRHGYEMAALRLWGD